MRDRSPMIEFIRASVRRREYELSLHADDERLADGLTMKDIETALTSAEMLEDYPDDPRGASCLVLGFAAKRPLHLVCGKTRQDRLLIITTYRPQSPKWKDERTRNR